MEIIEFEEKYAEQVRDLLVELERYIISLDIDELDILGENYREQKLNYDLRAVQDNQGKAYIAVDKDNVLGLIMGIVRVYTEEDYLDYKCPKSGEITELIVSEQARNMGVGKKLIEAIEYYFDSIDCKAIAVDVFAYNLNAQAFYESCGYHTRMMRMIKLK